MTVVEFEEWVKWTNCIWYRTTNKIHTLDDWYKLPLKIRREILGLK